MSSGKIQLLHLRQLVGLHLINLQVFITPHNFRICLGNRLGGFCVSKLRNAAAGFSYRRNCAGNSGSEYVNQPQHSLLRGFSLMLSVTENISYHRVRFQRLLFVFDRIHNPIDNQSHVLESLRLQHK